MVGNRTGVKNKSTNPEFSVFEKSVSPGRSSLVTRKRERAWREVMAHLSASDLAGAKLEKLRGDCDFYLNQADGYFVDNKVGLGDFLRFRKQHLHSISWNVG